MFRNQLPNIAAGKDWISKHLNVGIYVLTGAPQRGSEPSKIFNEGAVTKIWLLSHPVTDGAGKSARHFSLISKESGYWIHQNYFIVNTVLYCNHNQYCSSKLGGKNNVVPPCCENCTPFLFDPLLAQEHMYDLLVCDDPMDHIDDKDSCYTGVWSQHVYRVTLLNQSGKILQSQSFFCINPLCDFLIYCS